MTNRYLHIEKLMNLLEDRESFYIVICGNKVDFVQRNERKKKDENYKRAVDKKEAETYCASIKAPYFETSALTGESVNDAFNFLFMGAFDKLNQNLQTDSKENSEGGGDVKSNVSRKRQNSVNISKNEDSNQNDKKC